MSTAPVAGQTSQEPTFRSGVDLIEVDVNVVDGDGQPIPDLDAEEFTVSVDGEPRPVVQAQFVPLASLGEDARPAEPASRAVTYTSNAAELPGRLIVMAVDDESIQFGEGRHVTRAAAAFVDGLMPADRVALRAVPSGLSIDFTADHAHIRRELERMGGLGKRMDRGGIGLSEAFDISQFGNLNTWERVVSRRCGSRELDTPCAGSVRATSQSIVSEVEFHSNNSRIALEAILRSLTAVEGSKAVVWISGGLVIGRKTESLLEIERLANASRSTLYVIAVDDPLTDVSQGQPSPSARQDRALKEAGLRAVVAFTRGELLRAHFNPGPVFDRLANALSGYYLLGVEARPADRDGERRAIDVSVRRGGALVRARREVRFTPLSSISVDERLSRMLQSPVSTNELTVRVATYAYPVGDTADSVRVMVATDVVGAVGSATDVTLGYALRNGDGAVVSNVKRQGSATAVETPSGLVLEDTLTGLLVGPEPYVMRVAVVDGSGRRGSVEHRFDAGSLSIGSLAISDLTVADRPPSSGQFPAAVEAGVSTGHVMAYAELHAESAAAFEQIAVHVDVAADEAGPALASAPAPLRGPTGAPLRVAIVDLSVEDLPPGPYVARVHVVRGDVEVARRVRSFRIAASPD